MQYRGRDANGRDTERTRRIEMLAAMTCGVLDATPIGPLPMMRMMRGVWIEFGCWGSAGQNRVPGTQRQLRTIEAGRDHESRRHERTQDQPWHQP